MKYILVCLILFSISCSTFNQWTQDTSDTMSGSLSTAPKALDKAEENDLRRRVVVLPFANRTKYMNQNLGTYTSNMLSDLLVRTKNFVVVPVEETDRDPKTLMIDQDFDHIKIVEYGRQAGLNGVLYGVVDKVKVVRAGDEVGIIKQMSDIVEVGIRIVMIDIRSGQVLLDHPSVGRMEETGISLLFTEDSDGARNSNLDLARLKRAMYRAFLDVMPRIQKTAAKVDWSGRIVRLEGERIFLNAGQQTGLRMGDTLKVLEDGDDVYDPITSKLIGRAPGRMKGTVKIVNFFGKDGSLAIVESGAGFQEGDRIELY